MTYEISCPVCGHIAKSEIYIENFGTCEEHTSCSTCGYMYEFAYGNHLEIVGNKWFAWSWLDYENTAMQKKRKRAVFMARRRWKKFKKGVTVTDCPF